MKAMELYLYRGKYGGRRPGAGRKRLRSPGVAHEKREKVTLRTPLHVNFKFRTLVRNKMCLKVLKKAIHNARKQDLRVIHFSLQSNHIHLILEGASNEVLTRGMRSLTITFAKGLRKGSIQIERYHLHVLKSLRETKNALYYVLFNQQKHANLKTAHIDPFSSLAAVKDLKTLAKESRMTIIWKKMEELTELSAPLGWMLKKILS